MSEPVDPLQDYERAKREAAARSHKSLLGDDFAEVCRLTALELERDRDAMLARQAAQAARTSYEGQHSYRCSVVAVMPKQWIGLKPPPPKYVATTLEHPPLVGELKAIGRDPQHAVKELRFAYACTLVKMKLLASMSDARAYCLKANFYQEISL